MHDQEYGIIAAIGRLKVGEIHAWRADLMGDVSALAHDPFTIMALQGLVRGNSAPIVRAELQGSLRTLAAAAHYSDARLVAPQGKILAAARPDSTPLDPAVRLAVTEALSSGKPVLSKLYRGSDGLLHIAAAAAVSGVKGRPLAVAILQADTRTVLEPLLRDLPTSRRSAETVLIQREGNQVMALSGLHRPSPAFTTRHEPLTRTDLPAVQVVLGKRGAFEGRDFLGVPVLANLSAIPGSPWYLVARVDSDEVLARARREAMIVALIVGLLVLVAAALTAYLYRLRQVGMLSALFESEQQRREVEAGYRTTLYSIGDAVIATDIAGRIREMNPTAERLTGWAEAEARGQPLEDVFRIFNETTRAALANPVRSVLSDGVVVGLANHTVLVARDGTERPIADSAAPIREGDGAPTGVVLVFSDQTAHHAAAKALRESEERFRLAAAVAAVGVLDLHVETRELTVDAASAAKFWLDASQPRESVSAWTDRMHPDDRGAVTEALDEILTGAGDAFRAEFRERARNGEWIWNLAVGKIVERAHDGRPLRMLGARIDITRRKAREERIERLSNLYAALSQCNQAIVHCTSEEELFSRVCRAAVQFGGMRMAWIGLVDQATQRIVPVAWDGTGTEYLRSIEISTDATHPSAGNPASIAIREDRPYWEQDFQDAPAMAAWRSASAQFGWRTKAVLPIHRSGKPVGILALYGSAIEPFDDAMRNLLSEMTADVSFALDNFARETARNRAEGVLRLRGAALNAVADAIFITDREGTVHWVNAAFTALTGYTDHEAVGRTPGDLIKSGVQDAAFYQGMWGTILAGETWRGDLTNRRKDGSQCVVELAITPVKNAAGAITHFVAIEHDLTQRRLLEAQFLQAQKMESVGRLAGGIAHDFNNLLTVINGTADLAAPQLPEAHPLADDLRTIREAGDRAAALTRQLLAFSRNQVMRLEIVNLNELAVGMRGMLQRLIGEDIEIVVVTAAELGNVRADPGQMEQVIVNLVVNARDAMPTGGRLAIETQNVDLDASFAAMRPSVRPGRHVMLAVSDTGVGMDQATLDRVFEPFFTTKERGKGTGLGLSTVYGIVKQNGGSIWVYSEPGAGTAFKIYLPRVDEVAEPVRPVAQVGRVGGAETILVVEDELALRQLAERVLKAAGYSVLTAENGDVALSVLAHHDGPVHLMVTDVVLPGISGRDLAQRVAVAHPAVRVLYTSGYTDDTMLRHGIIESTTRFVAKPYSVAQLRQAVRDALDAPVHPGGRRH
ncbi:MAG: PAS domain S-box protein [Gemmatimonadaceae bacterium]